MSGFLDAYADERTDLLASVERLERSWATFTSGERLGDGEDAGLLSNDLAAVRTSLSTQRFSVGLFGLVKRGKSTLLNALVGREVSSTHVNPETAVPVYVEGGRNEHAEVRFVTGTTREVEVAEAVTYTSQKHNPDNREGVLYVRQFVSSPLVRHGVRLIDTPGLDDADIDDRYTELTLRELDEVDAGIVVFQSPPTVGYTEMRFLEQAAERGLTNVVFVCNMIPEHYHDDEIRTQVLDYIRGNLQARIDGPLPPLVAVCAIEGWRARLEDDASLWVRSGLGELLAIVEERLSARARRELLDRAASHLQVAAEAMIAQVRRHRVLLDDPDTLHGHRIDAERTAHGVERELRGAVGVRVAEAGRAQAQARAALESRLREARATLTALDDVREAQRVVRNARQEVELAAGDAGRAVAAAAEVAAGLMREDLARVATDVTVQFSERLDLHRSAESLNVRSESAQLGNDLLRSVGGAVAGGAAGGLGLIAVGALLGPLGLVAGALAGWRLGGGAASGLDRLRSAAIERFDELADDVLRAFDEATDAALTALRTAAHRRIRGYIHELLQPLDRVEAVADDDAARHTDLARCERLVVEAQVVLAGAVGIRELTS